MTISLAHRAACEAHQTRADFQRLGGQRFSLPSMPDCYDYANHCLDMWNNAVDHVARSEFLRMADAWLQLASELDG
jgi:hypothetical protein